MAQNTTQAATPSFSVESWIKTTTKSGGKIVGYGGSKTGNSGSYDRHVYMDKTGHVFFGVYTGSARTVSSPKSYNDGVWHHIVASLSNTAGMTLYVDGKKVASDPGTTSAQDYAGFWRIGGDNLSGWPSRPTSDYFAGAIDDVAIYPTALSLTQVAAHYTDGSTVVPNQPPTAAFTNSVDKRTGTFDATTSSDDGTITSYDWSFGDGQTAKTTTPTTTHVYAAPGSYTATLKVTDDKGATGTTTNPVTVPVTPNEVPDAPNTLTATSGDSTASLDWAPPTDNGGTAITGYTVTLTQPGAAPTQTQTVGPAVTTFAFTALTNGVTYTLAVVANNSVGTGPAATTTATPATVPGPATSLRATRGPAGNRAVDGSDQHRRRSYHRLPHHRHPPEEPRRRSLRAHAARRSPAL